MCMLSACYNYKYGLNSDEAQNHTLLNVRIHKSDVGSGKKCAEEKNISGWFQYYFLLTWSVEHGYKVHSLQN